jgi:signal transduction histidine kinase
MRGRRGRIGERWEIFFDLVAVATVVAGSILLATGQEPDGSPWLDLALLAISLVLLAVRRRAPLVAAIAAIVTSGLALLVPDGAVAIWVLAEVCLFSLPLRRSRTSAIIVATIHAALLYVGAVIVFQVAPVDPIALILPVWTGAVVAFGTALRAQQDYVEALEEQARSAAAARENEVLRRVDAERLHIARDLHDSVANSIAVINLEASNAARHVDDDGKRVRQALAVIRSVTRSTLGELAGILAVLRSDQDDSDRTVAVAANIPHLIELMSIPEFPISAELDALAELRLDPSADAALYRVAQESLTNAHRHGRPPVHLAVARSAEDVMLTVANGLASGAERTASGFGLIGMRERVELAGGTLHAGIEGDRFVVRLRLPSATDRARRRP